MYRENDKPMYRTGNKILLAICGYNFVLFIGAKLFYVWRNRYDFRISLKNVDVAEITFYRVRDRRWNELSLAERKTYLATTKDKGNKRLDFRFAH
jgi:hypothetical protein